MSQPQFHTKFETLHSVEKGALHGPCAGTKRNNKKKLGRQLKQDA